MRGATLLESVLLVRPWRTALDTLRRIEDEPSSVPRMRAMSSSMLKSPPALHLGSLGDTLASGWSGAELTDSFPATCVGGAGGALGVMYVSLILDAATPGRGGSVGPCSSVLWDFDDPDPDLPLAMGQG